MLKGSQIAVLQSPPIIVTPLIFRKNLISDTFLVITQYLRPWVRIGTNIDLNTESFAFLDSSYFKVTEWCKTFITALALPDQTSIFVLPSITCYYDRKILEFLHLL